MVGKKQGVMLGLSRQADTPTDMVDGKVLISGSSAFPEVGVGAVISSCLVCSNSSSLISKLSLSSVSESESESIASNSTGFPAETDTSLNRFKR